MIKKIVKARLSYFHEFLGVEPERRVKMFTKNTEVRKCCRFNCENISSDL